MLSASIVNKFGKDDKQESLFKGDLIRIGSNHKVEVECTRCGKWVTFTESDLILHTKECIVPCVL